MPIDVRVDPPLPKPTRPFGSTGPIDEVLARPSGLLPLCRYDAVRPSMALRSRSAARRAIAMISIWSQG
jgi:hypothetical protein